MSTSSFSVVVVGGGFSGTMLAIHLLRRAPGLSVAVIDKGPVPARGLAYCTDYHCHLLNVPASNMSPFPEEPDHFLRWAEANHDPAVQPGSFLPRPLYGRYLGSLLEEAKGRDGGGNLRWIQGEVCSVGRERSQIDVHLKDGSKLMTEALVLAAGNFPPANPRLAGFSGNGERYVRSPWAAGTLKRIAANRSVLLIGSGLTSVDVAVGLNSEGFSGHIHILSRHGLRPQLHRPMQKWPQFWNEQSPRTTRGLLRLVRQQVRAAAEAGVDWRAVMQVLRTVTQRIWQSLPMEERRRFLRHLRPYWEIHRHRIASEIGESMAQLVQQGRATFYAGRVTSYRELRGHVEVGFCDRKSRAERMLRVDQVINCTGPESDYRRIDDALIKSLLAQGLARPDPLFLGLDVDINGALVDLSDMQSKALYAIGPARKGFLWESIAVPELRIQAHELAMHLAQWLSKPDADSAKSEAAPRELVTVS